MIEIKSRKQLNKEYGVSIRQIKQYGFKLSLEVYEKCNRKCSTCGNTDHLAIHHIDGSGKSENPNNNLDNLLLICRECHSRHHANILWVGHKLQTKEDLRTKNKERYQKNKREINEISRNYYEKNKTKIKLNAKIYYQKNIEKIKLKKNKFGIFNGKRYWMYKKIGKYNMKNKLIKEYPSILEAASDNNILRTSISNCLKNRVKKSGGFIWRYQ